MRTHHAFVAIVAQAFFLRMHGELVLQIVGDHSENPAELSGRLFDNVRYPCKLATEKVMHYIARLNLCLCFGAYNEAAKLAWKYGNLFVRVSPGHMMNQQESFLRGMAFYSVARRTKNWSYQRAAKKALNRLKAWKKAGCPNVLHTCALLSAEQAAIDGNKDAAESFYKESIVLAGRSGHLYYAALANERYADFCKTILKDSEEASYRLSEAKRFYSDWGATRKVDMLPF